MLDLAAIHRRLVAHGATTLPQKLLMGLLLPLSILYGIVGWLRNFGYDHGLFSIYRSALPVVSVGNLAAGGIGKTPVVDWLIKTFVEQGRRVAVISRGYAGSFSGTVGIVSAGNGILMDPVESGDEPVLLARRNPRTPVLIARKRAAALKTIEQSFAVDLVILDDAFQHRAVGRDVNLVLLDANHPFGNGWPLPAGNLREFPGSLRRADLVLLTRVRLKPAAISGVRTFSSRHCLADMARTLAGATVQIEQLKNIKLLAFAGIASPDNFFSALSALGLDIRGRLSLPDHVAYSPRLLKDINLEAAAVDALITTEKDAVKLSADMFELPCYQVPMNLEVEDEDAFTECLNQKLWSR